MIHNRGLSVAVRAFDELPEEQREIYRARYLVCETREATCKRLGIEMAKYDEVCKEIMRSLRRMVSRNNVQPASV